MKTKIGYNVSIKDRLMASEANLLADVIQTHGREYFANKFAQDKKVKRNSTRSYDNFIDELEDMKNKNIQNKIDSKKSNNVSPNKIEVVDTNNLINNTHKNNKPKLNRNYT